MGAIAFNMLRCKCPILAEKQTIEDCETDPSGTSFEDAKLLKEIQDLTFVQTNLHWTKLQLTITRKATNLINEWMLTIRIGNAEASPIFLEIQIPIEQFPRYHTSAVGAELNSSFTWLVFDAKPEN